MKNKRILYIDVLKVISLIFMACIHTYAFLLSFELLSPNVNIERYEVQVSILYLITPTIFIICMGAGLFINFNKDYKYFLKKGLWILLFGLILNILRGSLTYILLSIFDDSTWISEAWYWLWGSDILYFSGLFFLLFALFKYLKLKDTTIFIIVLIMFITSNIIGNVNIDNYTLNMVLSNLVYIDSDSYFPILTWSIFPMIGYFYQKYYDKSKNKNKYVSKIMILSFILLSITITSLILTNHFEDRYYLWGEMEFIMDIFPFLICVFVDFIYIGIVYYLSKLFTKEKINKIITYLSQNITRIYFVHWLVIMYLGTIYYLLFNYQFNSGIFVYIFGILVVILSILITNLINKIKESIWKKI